LAIKTLDLDPEPDPDLGIHNTATSLFCFMPCAGGEDAVVAKEEGGSGSFTIPILSSQLEKKISYKSPYNNTYTVQSKCKWFLSELFPVGFFKCKIPLH
jgi:hypothetical protein